MVGRLRGRVAVVFGAGSSGPGWGNGKAAAVLYAREGAQVVAVDIVEATARETATIITEEGNTALPLVADVTVSAQIAAAIERTLAAFGRLDIVHNNTGIGDFGGPVELDEERWDKVFAVNLKSVFLACKHALPVMERQGGGVITNISSIAGIGVGPYPYIAYYASKAGLNHLTRAIAVAYAAKGIRCNAILPGLIETPMAVGHPEMLTHYGSLEKLLAARHAQSPTGHMGDAWDVANAAVWLASDQAKYVNGVLLPVDGSISCRMG